MLKIRKACKPFGRFSTWQWMRAPFVGGLISAGPKAGHVQKNVSEPIVGNDESISLGRIEPFNGARDLENFQSLDLVDQSRINACHISAALNPPSSYPALQKDYY